MSESGAEEATEIHAALRWASAAAGRWGVAADGDAAPRALVELEALELAPHGVTERVLFFGLIGPSASHGRDAGSAYVAVRTAVMAAGELLLARVVAGELSGAFAVEQLWRDATAGQGASAWLGGVALALRGALPLSLEGPEPIRRVVDPATAALVGFGVGRAARRGDMGAQVLCRELLEDAGAWDLAVGLIKGLGEGGFAAGLAWLAQAAVRAPFEQAAWGRACRVAALVGMNAGPVAVAPVLTEGLSTCADRDEALEFLETALAATPEVERPSVLDQLTQRWERWSPVVRAALVALAAKGLRVPIERLSGERGPEVLREVLRRLDAGGLGLEADQERRLLRSWAGHADAEVRRGVARRVLAGGATELHGPHPDDVAELVALPPSALVRNPLDQLRAALWTGESDGLVALARSVPPEERLAAREALFLALDVPNAALRRACIEALGYLGTATDGSRLMVAARAYRALEGTVASALRHLNARGQADALAELYQRRLKWADDEAVDDYCAIAGPERVMRLVAALETRFYPGARAGAARAIARIEAQEVVFALRNRGLCDPQEAARVAALQALQDLTGAAPSADELAGYALLFRPSDELDEAVERARAAGKAALPGLRRTLAKGSWRRRQAACEVLTMIPGRDAEETLVETLLDADEDVRMTAMEALLERGWTPRNAREHTLTAVASRRPWLLAEQAAHADSQTLEAALELGGFAFRSELLDAMARIPGWVASPAIQPTLHAARLDGDGAVALPGGVEAVLRALDRTWQAIPHRARLARALHDVDAGVLADELSCGEWDWRAREALCQALARPGEDGGVAALATCVLDDDDDVRRAALEALAAVGTEAAAGAIAKGFVSPFQEFRELIAVALAAVGDAAWPVVRALETDAWWEGRQGAALTLRAWRGDRQMAADRLVVLATDGEYRVCQPARDGLEAHGLMPRRAAIREAAEQAQVMTIEGIEAWVGVDAGLEADPEIVAWLDSMVELTPPDALPQRLGLIPLFRAEHLAVWLEEAALGFSTRHVGVRLAAADALRALVRRHCTACHGEGAVRCPECGGAGDQPCQRCAGQTLVLVTCPEPDCTARQTMRRIDSQRCQTCRGKGQVAVPCECSAASGRVACELCRGSGRIGCVACDGTGAAPRVGAEVAPE